MYPLFIRCTASRSPTLAPFARKQSRPPRKAKERQNGRRAACLHRITFKGWPWRCVSLKITPLTRLSDGCFAAFGSIPCRVRLQWRWRVYTGQRGCTRTSSRCGQTSNATNGLAHCTCLHPTGRADGGRAAAACRSSRHTAAGQKHGGPGCT